MVIVTGTLVDSDGHVIGERVWEYPDRATAAFQVSQMILCPNMEGRGVALILFDVAFPTPSLVPSGT